MSYYINTEKCNACGNCLEVCMDNAVLDLNNFYYIDPKWCTECGCCIAFCYENAIGHTELDTTPAVATEPMELVEYQYL